MRGVRSLFAQTRELFPLTAGGAICLLVALVGTWWVGVGTSDLVLMIGGSCLVALLLCFLLTVVVGAALARRQLAAIARRPVGDSLSLDCERVQATGFELRVPRWLPFLHYEIRWIGREGELEAQFSQTPGRLQETVLASRRGSMDSLARMITVRDGLRFASVSLRFEQERAARVLPAAGVGRQRLLLRSLVAGDDLSSPLGEAVGDRVDMRAYTAGDSPRTILWKVFARSRKLMVKVPERALAARPRTCAYQVATSGDEASASVARDIIEHDLLGDGWRFGADGSPSHSSHKAESLDMLARSGNESARRESCGLARFLGQAAQAGYCSCFVLLGDDATLRRDDVLSALATPGIKVVLCLAVCALRARPPATWQRLLFWQAPVGGLDLDALEGALAQWKAVPAGVELHLVDVSSGELYRDVPALLRTLRSKRGG